MERELLGTAKRFLILAAAVAICWAQKPAAPPQAEPAKEPDAARRVELNLLGKTDAQAGESRRNENIQFNLVDNNSLKELNVRLGTTATIIEEFHPGRSYFGAEFGNPPSGLPHLSASTRQAIHGTLYVAHLNSIFSARSFFQVGPVKPARENDYGFSAGLPVSRRWYLQLDGSQQKLRGNVNGNVLVPAPEERRATAADPATRALIARFFAAYPAELPNRTDINARALNTNSTQVIDNTSGSVHLQSEVSSRDKLIWQYQFTSQAVDAFQLVAGQNPDTDTRSHRARWTWNRAWNAFTITHLTGGFDRIGSLLLPEENAVGPMISIAGLTTLGPLGNIPIDRAQNLFRYGGQISQARTDHQWQAGFNLFRRQFNGVETDAHRGFFSFANDFGRDAITNFQLGQPAQHIVSLGDVHRGFRNWDVQAYVGDKWRPRPGLQVQLGIRYQAAPAPHEVNGRNPIAYDCDCNNVAPQIGLAWQPGGFIGSLRAGYGLHYGEILPVTFSQVRFSPPGSVKVVVAAPSLTDPFGGRVGDAPRNALSNLYLLDPELATPYTHIYHLAWEPETRSGWRLQIGFVGSRSHKLPIMWYLNRAHAVPGIAQITATINQRRPDPNFAEKRWVLNGSRGYFDAGRVTLVVPRWRGLSVDASYWFSKAIDTGSSYTNTAYDGDSRLSRSQSEFETIRDMRGLSSFDQTHAFLVRAGYELPNWGYWGGWRIASVALLKSGTPFQVSTGADGPGFGNVDGNGGDRPNILDPSILGRTIGHPDTSAARLPRSAFAFFGPFDEFGGTLGKNTFRKGGIYNVNASLGRSWTVGVEKKLSLRAESVNLFNTPQFAEPGAELTNPNFGAITNTLNDGRTVRFWLQLGW